MLETGFHILGISFSIFIYIFYVPNFRSNKKQGNVKKTTPHSLFENGKHISDVSLSTVGCFV